MTEGRDGFRDTFRPWLSDVLGPKGSGPLILEEEMLDGATLGDLLKKLTAKHQAFEEVLFDPMTHQLKGPVGIVINDQLAQSLQDLNPE